jgi:hypothetical protein
MRRRGISASSEAEARSRRRLRAPRKADDVDPFFPVAFAANALAGFPGPARAYPIAAERMPRRRRRAPLHPLDEPRNDPGCAATRPAPSGAERDGKRETPARRSLHGCLEGSQAVSAGRKQHLDDDAQVPGPEHLRHLHKRPSDKAGAAIGVDEARRESPGEDDQDRAAERAEAWQRKCDEAFNALARRHRYLQRS